MKNKFNVDILPPRCVLLFGGRGYEHSVSFSGAVNFLMTAEKLGLDIIPILIDKNGDFYLCKKSFGEFPITDESEFLENATPTFPVKLGAHSGFLTDDALYTVKVAIPLLHGDYGEDGTVQGLLESLNINFIGADTVSGALCSDKAYSKIIAEAVGVPTLPQTVFEKNDFNMENAEKAVTKYGYPVFIKPARLGSSVGASIANCKQEFIKSIENAFDCSNRIMIEPALTNKREIECAYYSMGRKTIISEPGEIVADGKFYDYELKYSSDSCVILHQRAVIDKQCSERIKHYTEVLAKAFSVRHIARFDYFLLPDGKIYFNEVNTFPGMTEKSLYAAMLKESGVSFEDFVLSLVGFIG